MSFVDRFFQLQAAGKSESFRLDLRAVFRHLPKTSIGPDNEEAELALYVDNWCVWRKYRIIRAANVSVALEEMMYDVLIEAVLFGLYAKQRQQQFVRDENLGAAKSPDFLCPERLSHYAVAPGELLPSYV
jgi:hypothetical protein